MITDRDKQFLMLEGNRLSREEIMATDIDSVANPLKDLFVFLKQWYGDSDKIIVHTSGSTGNPKRLEVDKCRMIQSALLTCNYLELKAGDTALLCMNLRYIGAMMMVVRSLVCSLNLTVRPASGHPLAETSISFDFCAMVPLQVYNSLSSPLEKERLKGIKKLIIGGGAVDKMLQQQLISFSNAIYSTYGMTETLSHIALRRLNGKQVTSRYIPFENIHLSVAADGTLIIEAPTICSHMLHTNDIVTLYDDGSFEIRGRKDNVINSGGIKIQIEEDEKMLKQLIVNPFAITSVPDERLGEAVVMLIEGIGDAETCGLQRKMTEMLPKYHCPKHLIAVDKLPMTGNSKIDRKACAEIARKQLK
jgi:O-succinylbenzoic acid--CoA ligase